jgi:hypothetical protein
MQRIIILLIFNQITFAQKTIVETSLHFSGKIDKYPIEMTINFIQESDSVFGHYYYVKNGIENPIYLKGSFKKNKLQLSESDYTAGNGFAVSGHFNLQLNRDNKLLGKWQGTTQAKIRDAQLSPLENLSAFNPMIYRYELNMSKRKSETTTDHVPDDIFINGLNIYNSKNEKIQTLAGFNGRVALEHENGKIILEDMNFDGLLDIRIPIVIDYEYKYFYFIYDKGKNKYIRNLKLEKLDISSFDIKNKECRSLDADGSSYEHSSYYKWLNNNIYLVRKSEDLEKNGYILITKYQIKNNKSVKVKQYKK